MSETRSLRLRDYVRHTESCSLLMRYWNQPCTCGLDAALRAQEPPQAQHELTVFVKVEQNGGEYYGWVEFKGARSVSFDPAHPTSLRVNGVEVTLDERIDEIAVNTTGQTLAEPWSIGHPPVSAERST